MVIRRRLFVMMLGMAVSSLLVLLLFWVILEKNIGGILRDRSEAVHATIARIIGIEGAVMKGLAYDYTHWTEMVDFVESGDQTWAELNLDTALRSFKCDACWVFAKDFGLVDYRAAEGAGLGTNGLTPAVAAEVFAATNFPHWFERIGSEFVEFRGGIVQPSDDVRRSTPAQGYFLVARAWDQDHIELLRDLFAAGSVELIEGDVLRGQDQQAMAASASHLHSLPTRAGRLPISLRSETNSPEIEQIVQMNAFSSVVISIMLVLTVALSIIGLTAWVSAPIKMMSDAMERKKPELVESLVLQKNEIGRLAQLIKSFFVQQVELEKEVGHRKEIQAKQEKLNAILRIWGRCNFAMATRASEAEMLNRVCNIVVDLGKYKAAWVGEVTWRGARASVKPVAKAGNDEGYVDLVSRELNNNADRASCLVGRCLRTRDVSACRGIDSSDPACDKWEREAGQRGIRAGACFPMVHQGEVFAVFAILSEGAADLDADERKVLAEVFENLGAGILLARSEEARREAERKAASLSEQLMRTQKLEAVGRLAGGIAHDFNNLLLVIMGNLELCLAEKGRIPNRSELAEAMDACRQASDLTRQLLSLGRRRASVTEPVDINDEINTALDLAKGSLKEDVKVKLDLDGNVGPVLGDPVQVRQIFTNLVVNAAEAMPEGGTFTLATESVCVEADFTPEAVPGDYVLITVADTGQGMDDEVMGHAFEPFFTTKKAGTGLGLALVNSIVAQHGGFIRASSIRGSGTTFRIFLPIADVLPGGESDIASMDVLRAGHSETVLLVEDRDMCRLLTRTMLGSLGYKVLDAGNPKDAVARAKEYSGKIDVVLTDVVMSGMSGPELVDALHEAGIDAKVVYMSGYADGALAEHGISGARVGMLQKPFMLAQLAQIMREAILKG